MEAELHAIQLHLWIITALLTAIFLAAGYCNYSRIKAQTQVSPYNHMKDLWERERFAELRDYTSAYLKTRPNTSFVLLFHAKVLIHYKDYPEARMAAEKLADSSPEAREKALLIIKLIDAKIANEPKA